MRCSMRSTFDSLIITPLDSLGGIAGLPFSATRSSTGRFSFELDQAKTGSQWYKIRQLRVVNSVSDLTSEHIVSVYPNPSSDVVVLEFNSASVPVDAIVAVRDILGRIVIQTPMRGEHTVLIPVGGLASGTYVAEIHSAGSPVYRTVFVRQ
jgi:hypothetical protein